MGHLGVVLCPPLLSFPLRKNSFILMIFRKDLCNTKVHSHRLIQENNVIRVRNVKCTHIVIMGLLFHRLQLIINDL